MKRGVCVGRGGGVEREGVQAVNEREKTDRDSRVREE